jgi:hypothetical protein
MESASLRAQMLQHTLYHMSGMHSAQEHSRQLLAVCEGVARCLSSPICIDSIHLHVSSCGAAYELQHLGNHSTMTLS